MAKARITTKVDANTRPFERKMDRAAGRAKQFKSKMAAVGKSIAGAFAIGAVVQFARSIINLGSQISDMVDQTGLSAQSFQALGMAARDAGASEQTLVNVMTRLRSAQGKVIDNDKLMADSFANLGMSMDEIAQMDTEQLFTAMAKSFIDAGEGAKEWNAIAEIIGQKNMPKMLEVMRRLTNDGMPAMQAETEKLGQALEDDVLTQLDAVSDKLGHVGRKMQVFFANITLDAVGGIEKMAAFLGAVSAVGLTEAVRQKDTGELFGPDPAAAAADKKKADEDLKEKQRKARVQALADARARDAGLDAGPDAGPGKAGAAAKVARQRGPVSNLRRIGAGFGQAPIERLSQQQLAQLKKLVEISSKMYVADLQTADNTAQPNLSILG
jgi:hypothetical protein